MPLIRDLSKAQIAFQVGAGAIDQFDVLRYRGREGLCQLYRFEIELVSDEESIAFDDIVGKPAVLSVSGEHATRSFHGVVARFEVTGETAGQRYYRAELVPTLWMLTHRYNCRIFQGKSTPEIIEAVLTHAGITSDRVDTDGLARTYTPREYCVQYRETDYNFLCRLMEEEGIRWYFEHRPDKHVLMLEDGPSGSFAAIDGEATLEYRPPSGMKDAREHVFRFRLGQSVRPGAVTLNDFNFTNPALNLEAKSDCGRDTGLEFFDYPGEYREQAAGTDLATLRAEEFEAGRTVGVGQSDSPRLVPGRKFTLTDHSEGVNGEYFITQVTHQGKQTVKRTSAGDNGHSDILDQRVLQSVVAARQNENSAVRELATALLQIATRLKTGDPTAHRALNHWIYHAGQVSRDLASVAGASGANPLDPLSIPNLLEDLLTESIIDRGGPIHECRFECIPASVSYRPPRITPWPVMRGSQTARVVGPSGEEIYTDDEGFGRVKVQFNWDREGQFNESSSCWIRVSQGFAGGNYGMMFLPRIGQEVVVDFLEGDPDQPLITGRVYNSDHMPPYSLPAEKTKSCIKTNSSVGGEGTNEIRFEDLKDSEQILIFAQKDKHIRVQNDRVETVENDGHQLIGNNRFELVKKNYHLKVEEEAFNLEVGGDHSISIGGKRSDDVGGTCSTSIGSDLVESVGGGHKHDVTQNYALKAMGVKIEATSGIELKCGGSSIVLTPAAIFITGGPLVNINTGSGPPVMPPTALATSPTAPEAPGEADTVEPGHDTNYSGGQEVPAAEMEDDLPGHEFEPTEVEEVEMSWIAISLVDDAGNPVPGEPYEIQAPDGKTILKGSLDANGKAHRQVPGNGECQISFPKLDAEAWERM